MLGNIQKQQNKGQRNANSLPNGGGDFIRDDRNYIMWWGVA